MASLDLASRALSLELFGHTLSLTAVVGWVLFAISAYVAVRERVTGKRFATVPPLVGAGATLAAMSAGLGLLLADSYPVFAREFCFPYALLAVAVAVFGRALQAGGRPLGGKE